MAQRIGFNLDVTDKKLQKLMSTLKKIGKTKTLKGAMQAAMEDIQREIAQQWKNGGNLVAYTLKGKKRYKKWRNAKSTLARKKAQGGSKRVPGVQTGDLRKAMKFMNKAYAGTAATSKSIKLKIKVVDKYGTNYAGYFDDQMGLIPAPAAVKNIVRVGLEENIEIMLSKGGFKKK